MHVRADNERCTIVQRGIDAHFPNGDFLGAWARAKLILRVPDDTDGSAKHFDALGVSRTCGRIGLAKATSRDSHYSVKGLQTGYLRDR